MSRKNTIIFGGAFNPPTVAHETILEACIDSAKKLDADIWIIPSGNRYDKQIQIDRQIRIEYIIAMIKDVKAQNINILTIELDRREIVETIDTAKELIKLYPERSFIWVFGSDSVKTMNRWRGGDWLLENLQMLIVERENFKINTLYENQSILDVEMINISSTEIRRRLAVGEQYDGLVGRSVKKLLNIQKASPV